MASVTTQNPKYNEHIADWELMRHSYEGQRKVKEQGTLYLPPTRGMELDGMEGKQPGQKAYQAYLSRAVYRAYVKEAVIAMVGFMHQQPPTIDLPAGMEDMREKATVAGESLEDLMRRINAEQLITGRVGLLADLPAPLQTGPVLPYIAIYHAEHAINWDDGTEGPDLLSNLNLVVLNESGMERDQNLEWRFINQYRVLVLGRPIDTFEAEGSGIPATGLVYKQGVYRSESDVSKLAEGVVQMLEYDDAIMVAPQLMGSTLEEIPFVFINSSDILANPDDPPLLELANLCMTIYRGEADYRQVLHHQGQDTLVITGAQNDDGEKTWRLGTGASIELPMGGTAEFIGISADGISHQQAALEADKEEASSKAMSLLTNESTSHAESGEALNIRVAARTATLLDIAKTGASGLEKLLRLVARWRGLDETQVKVTPNTDFVSAEMTGQELVQFIMAKRGGAPLSNSSLHQLMVDRGITSKTYEEEIAAIQDEADDIPLPTGTGVGGNPNPNDPNNQQNNPPANGQ